MNLTKSFHFAPIALLAIATAAPLSVAAQNTNTRVPHSSQYLKAYAKPNSVLRFDVNKDIKTCNIPEAPIKWGMDVAWNWDVNVERGTNFIGKDILSVGVGRVSFQPSDLVDANGNLSAAQKATLDSRLNNIKKTGVKTINLNCDHEVLMNKDSYPNCDKNYANYNGKPEEWYKVIKATMKYCQSKGFTVVSVSPYNEPDYTGWKEGSKSEFKEIAKLIAADPDFEGVRICAGNTLNCDEALGWYNAVKPYVSEGNTHQLAGSFANYKTFWQTVRADGNYATADELHNTMEAFVGIHYGMQAGIWWGYDALSRGEFCKASANGKEIGYAESTGTWSAGTVYKRENGRVDAFLGGSERQANTTTFDLVSTTRPVYFDGHGPYYNYQMTIPGGTGYQKGQTNAERMIQVLYGEDVPLNPLTNGEYMLLNKQKYVISANSASSGSNVGVTNSTTYSSTQGWVLEAVPSTVGGDFTYYYVKSAANTNLYMNLRDFSRNPNGTFLLYQQENHGANEQFSFEYAGNDYWYIRVRESGLYLQQSGTSLVQNTFTGDDTQKWMLRSTSINSKSTTTSNNNAAPPANLAAEGETAGIRLTWDASTAIVAKPFTYNVLRAEKSDNPQWDVIARKVDGTEFFDNMVVPGREYIYKVKTVNKYDLTSTTASPEATAKVKSDKGLVARYTFETSIEDETDNMLDAALPGTPAYGSGNYKKEGNQSLKLSSSFAQLPGISMMSKEMTIAMWVYIPIVTGNYNRVFDFGSDTDHYMFLSPKGDNKCVFAMKNGGAEQRIETSLLSYGWRHVAVTISDEEVTLYVGGEKKVSSKDITIRPNDILATNAYLGRSQFEADPLFSTTYFDDVRIYNYPLTADEVKKAMNGEVFDGIENINAEQNNGAKAASDKVYSIDGKQINSKKSNKPELRIMSGKKVVVK